MASAVHYVALGDSISIDDYSGGPGRGGASLLFVTAMTISRSGGVATSAP